MRGGKPKSEKPKPGQSKPGKPKKRGGGARPEASASAAERAASLLERLESGGPKPVNAAEEVDRLQAALERGGRLEGVRERVAALCDAWSDLPLRAEQAQAWLVLVGGFGLAEHAGRVEALLANPGLPAGLRAAAARVLAELDPDHAAPALARAVASNTDPQVRVAGAEALAELGDRTVAPLLRELLDEDLPRPVWTAVNAAVDRLR